MLMSKKDGVVAGVEWRLVWSDSSVRSASGSVRTQTIGQVVQKGG